MSSGRGALAGRRLAVTRAREGASAVAEKLEALGAEVLRLPVIAVEPPASWEPLDGALRALGGFDWLVVTSANSARAIGERMAALGVQVPAQGQPRVAVVGPATAAAVRAAGLAVELEPREAVAEALAEVLAPRVAGARVLFARAEIGREVLPEALRAAGAREVVRVATHRTVAGPADAAYVAEVLPGLDAVLFASSSSVSNLFAMLARAGVGWPPGVCAVSIGPVTSATLREGGVEPAGEAAQHTLPGLVEAVLRVLGSCRFKER